MAVAWLLSHISLLYFLTIIALSPTNTNTKSRYAQSQAMPTSLTLDSIQSSVIEEFILKIPFKKLKLPRFRAKTKAGGGGFESVGPRDRYKGKEQNQGLKENKFKHKQTDPPTTIPLFPRSFGAFTLSLGFGTPKQTTPLVFDTASNLVWVPCTSKYSCSNCSFPNIVLEKTPIFDPVRSFSKPMYCEAKMCRSIHRSKLQCNYAGSCPGYEFMYASWTTEGILIGKMKGDAMKDTVEDSVADFVFGCTHTATHLPFGRVGFGSAPESMPSQLGLEKFSFCLLSHFYDDTGRHSALVLNDDLLYNDLSYTPLMKAPEMPNSHFYEYRYVNLREIIVGNTQIKIPEEDQVLGADGNGGTIIDTSVPFTYLGRSVFQQVAEEFVTQIVEYGRAPNQGVLGPCFSTVDKGIFKSVPGLSFVFDGGAKMVFPISNYLLYDDTVGALCLSLTTDIIGGEAPNVGLSGGPKIIMGNYLLMDFHLEFDLKLGRLGFKQENCD